MANKVETPNGLKRMSLLHGYPIHIKQKVPKDSDGAFRLRNRLDGRHVTLVHKGKEIATI